MRTDPITFRGKAGSHLELHPCVTGPDRVFLIDDSGLNIRHFLATLVPFVNTGNEHCGASKCSVLGISYQDPTFSSILCQFGSASTKILVVTSYDTILQICCVYAMQDVAGGHSRFPPSVILITSYKPTIW